MQNLSKTLFAPLFSFCLIISILLTSVDYHCFNFNFYKQAYIKLDTANSIGISQSDLEASTLVLLDYLQDKRSDIDLDITKDNQSTKAFNKRESDHMIDVKNLYQNAILVRNICIIVAIISLIIMIKYQGKAMLLSISQAFLKVSILFILIISFLGLYAYVDFNSFWTNFHQVFFTNDLWLLNPNTDMMINLFPEPFFYELVMRIVITFAICFIACIITSILYYRKKVKQYGHHSS